MLGKQKTTQYLLLINYSQKGATFDNYPHRANEKHLANLVHNYIKILGKSEENYPKATFDN